MSRTVRRLDPATRPDFRRIHCEANGAGWCHCVAWWVESFDGWGERTAEQNLELREELFARGEDDGYLLMDGEEPIAWCQVGPRDRLPNLLRRYGPEPDPAVWAVTCFVVVPSARRSGAATELLAGVLEDLRARGVPRVQAFPRRGATEPGAMWTGPEALFLRAGFTVERDDPQRPVLSLALSPGHG